MAQFPDEEGEDGSFKRQPDEFRNWVETPEAGRYHLYVCKACPWAHRAWLTRNQMGLDEAISVNEEASAYRAVVVWRFFEGVAAADDGDDGVFPIEGVAHGQGP